MDSQSSPYSSHDPSAEERRLNHMIFPQHIPLPQRNTFNMTETDQLQYDTTRGDYLKTNPIPMNLARPDIDMLMQDIDISSFSLADLDAFCSPQKNSNVSDDIAQFYMQPLDYLNTTGPSQVRCSSSTATSPTYLFDQILETPVNQGLPPQVLNQALHSTAPMQQDPAMGTYLWEPIANSLFSMKDGVMAGSMMGPKESSLLDRKKNSSTRGFRRRRYHPHHTPNRKAPQSSASGGIKNGTPIPLNTPTMPRDNMTSRSMTDVEGKKDDHVDPEQALNLLKRSIETQPYSSISQREMAALIKKIEDVVLREKLYGSSSSDSGEVTIPSTVSDSISNSENIEPEYSSDTTSVSSTPRLTVDEAPDAEAAEVQTVHKMNCPHCGNRPNYYCSKPGCGYFAHTRGDAKRHEEGEKHYPQARFMCCECPLVHAQLDGNGNPICEFCNTFCLNSGLLRAHYLHCADAKNLGKTFSRKDHFIQHLREEHNIFNDAQYVVTSRYPIASNWPRQCSRCHKTFQTWEERMEHLAEHAEEDFHPRGFSKRPKDGDDDDGNDGHHGGGGGSQGKGAGRQIQATLPMQHNHASTSFNNASSSCDNYRSRTPGTLLGMSEQPVLSRKPSPALERYLNDEESPVPIPVGYQKCESQDIQLVTHTLQNNNSEMKYQELAASDGNTQPLHARKRSPPPGIPLAAVQDMQDEDAGCIQPTGHNSLQESTGAHRQLLTATTAPNVQVPKTPLSAKMKLCPNNPIPIPSLTKSVVKSAPAYRQISTSIPSSTCDGLTDLSSSVISFDDRESSSFGKNPHGELISFDGETIKQRARKRLSPRMAVCALEHHDIQALEGLPSQWESSQTLGNSPDATNPRAGSNIVVCDAGAGTVDLITYLIPSGSNFAPFHQHPSASGSRMRNLRFEDIPILTAPSQHTMLTTPKVGLKFDTGSGGNFISAGIIQKPGISTPQMRFELTENLASAKFEVGEWPRLESELHYWISGMPNFGKSHLGKIVLNGPWSNKEPTSRLSAQGVRCNHCLTNDLHDLLKPDRKPVQSMRGDDSVSAVLMETPHVQFKTTDNKIDAEHAESDLTQTDPGRTESEAHARIESYTGDQEWRENINEQIQELSRLVPTQRLEDEKVGKPLQNKSPLRPILAGLSTSPRGMSPTQATSGLAGPGARLARNIISSIPIEENEKGPNKGDILNCAVSWTRDLMWMLHLKLQQQEDLADIITELGGTFRFEESEDERRIYTEVMEVMAKNDGTKFHSKFISQASASVSETTTASKELQNWLAEERDSGYEASLRSYVPTVYEMNTANKELAESIAKSPTKSERGKALSQQPVKVRKASTVSTYLFKLMKKDTEIIEAACDGDIAKVAKLISRGANVNARDRWGWSALSMCAYGAYLDIARLLLDHGADLDNTDVDGDTPEILAMSRGHMDMVKLFHEERLSRVSERSATPLSLARDMEGQLSSAK